VIGVVTRLLFATLRQRNWIKIVKKNEKWKEDECKQRERPEEERSRGEDEKTRKVVDEEMRGASLGF